MAKPRGDSSLDFITIVVYVKLMIHSWTLNEMKRGATKGEQWRDRERMMAVQDKW